MSNARPVLVAPDKFKGTLSAAQVATALAEGLARAGIVSDLCRVADGGEGTLDVLTDGVEHELLQVPASDALGRKVEARVAVFAGGRTAVIETADAIGLSLIAGSERDAVAASSRGAGELIAAAAATGVREVLVGVGGTAMTDGGMGAIEALREANLIGVRGPGKRLPKLIVLCDARAGWQQAVSVFSEQKGAGPRERELLTARFERLAGELPRDPREVLFTGCGGGLAGGLWACAGAELKSGAAVVLDRLDFSARMVASRAVITGEGCLDHQTLLGKAVGEIATRARQSGVPCHAIVGRRGMTEFDARILDFETVTEAGSEATIADAAERLAPVLATS
ncbi:MAG: glycerate kinase [Actinobacteria bacterium]|nr:glycerate kinase [Actinomycetota bacterium]